MYRTILYLWALICLKTEAKGLRNPRLQITPLSSPNPDETQFLAEAKASLVQQPYAITVGISAAVTRTANT